LGVPWCSSSGLATHRLLVGEGATDADLLSMKSIECGSNHNPTPSPPPCPTVPFPGPPEASWARWNTQMLSQSRHRYALSQPENPEKEWRRRGEVCQSPNQQAISCPDPVRNEGTGMGFNPVPKIIPHSHGSSLGFVCNDITIYLKVDSVTSRCRPWQLEPQGVSSPRGSSC